MERVETARLHTQDSPSPSRPHPATPGWKGHLSTPGSFLQPFLGPAGGHCDGPRQGRVTDALSCWSRGCLPCGGCCRPGVTMSARVGAGWCEKATEGAPGPLRHPFLPGAAVLSGWTGGAGPPGWERWGRSSSQWRELCRAEGSHWGRMGCSHVSSRMSGHRGGRRPGHSLPGGRLPLRVPTGA